MTYEYSEVVAETADGRHRVILVPDTDCENPMDSGDWWVTSVLVVGAGWRSSYSDGDTFHDVHDRASAWRRFDDSWTAASDNPDETFTRYMRIFHGIEVHQVNWGSDQARALAWVEPREAFRVGLSREADGTVTDSKGVIETEVAEYNRWAEGECYGYVVQSFALDDPVTLDDLAEAAEDLGEHALYSDVLDLAADRARVAAGKDSERFGVWEDTDDSCWGFIGCEYAEQEAREALASYGEVA